MNKTYLNKLLWFYVFIAVVSVGSNSFAQNKGDRVVVTADVSTKIETKKVGRVFSGQIDTITATEGKWCALKRTRGWLPLQYVMNLESAEKHFTSRIDKNRNDYDALATRGMIRFENKQLDKALSDLNASIQLNPRNPVPFNNRGIILKAQNEYPKAIANLNQALKLNPNYTDAHENRGLVLAAMGLHEDAIKNYDNAIKLRKDNPWSFINRGIAKNNIGDYRAAKKDFSKARELDKNISATYVGLSIAYLGENEIEKSFQFASMAVKTNPRNGLAHNQQGWTNYKLGKLDEAIHDFGQAIRYDSQLSLAFNNRGICHTEKREYDKAIKDLNRAIALNPGSAVAYTNRGNTYMGLNKYEKARDDLKKAVKLAPKLSDAAHGLAWFQATCPEEKYRNGAEAIEYAEQACKLSDWKDWSFIDTFAAAHAEAGNFPEAVKMAEKALGLAPEKAKKDCRAHLELFQNEKPFRSKYGKSAK